MRRKIYNQLLNWKNSEENKSLLVLGARQVGKTYIIKEFGRTEFKHMLYLNFEDQLDLKEQFETMPNPDEAVKALQAYAISQNIFTLDKEKTLIFLDEIQLSKRTFSLMKPLTEMGMFRFILSGSLLGVNLGGDFLNPGPTVEQLIMNPMDFEEFLWAMHGEEIASIIDDMKQSVYKKEEIHPTLHGRMNTELKNYIIVGGMPQVVRDYKDKKDFGRAFQLQSAILDLYRADIQQYQSSNDGKLKTLKCFDSIPKQFAKDNHRFMYNTVIEHKKSRYFGSAIDWLNRTGDTIPCYQVNHFEGALIDGKSHLFKLFMNDIGLLVCMLGTGYVYKIQNDELGLFKGALFEQLVAQSLFNKSVPLFYGKINDYEIDYLIEENGSIIPIECKGGTNTKSKSLRQFIKVQKPPKAYKISMNHTNLTDRVIKAIPHYLFQLMNLEELKKL